jgi:beta-lactamase regulating signal transducer with metallopeptidase domain/protocatechuate 3,4-dioxygenase beta subunit
MSVAFSIDAFIIDEASAGRIAWFAADLGIKATLGLLGALVITWAARRSSAALRHRVWFLAFCGLLLLPVLPLVVPRWQIPFPAAFDRIRPAVSQMQPTLPPDSPRTDSDAQIPRSLRPEIDPFESSRNEDRILSADAGAMRETEQGRGFEKPVAQSPPLTTPTPAVAAMPSTRPANRSAWFYVGGLMAVVWAAGAGVSLFGILASRRRGRQLLRSAAPVLDPRWLEPFQELRESLRLGGRVTLLESSRAVVPMATGVLRPAVLLPRETEEWSTALRRHVLIHELAHVKRRDVLQHLISSAATALYWFHPLAWYGMRLMRLEREIACDDCVLMAGEPACDYAAELVGIARRMKGISTSWAVCMASGSTLEERVRAMLDRARSHGPMSARAARSLLIVALSAIGLLAAVEPGSSSVRKPPPKQTPVGNAPSSDNHGPAQSELNVVGRPVDRLTLAEADEKSPPKAVSKDPTFTFAGMVVDQQNRPVADARVSLSYFRSSPPAAEPAVATSDAHGQFEFSRKRSELADLSDERYLPDIRLIAVKEGHGFASVPAAACEKTGQLAAAIDGLKTSLASPTAGKGSSVLTLVPDDVPIRGRLLTIDGRPVAGAKIAVVAVWAGENGSLDAFEAKLKDSPGWQHLSDLFRGYPQAGAMVYLNKKRWYRNAAVRSERRPSIVAAVQSDADGRFEIRGLGRERMAEILITAPGLETALRFVRTRRGSVIPMGPEKVIPESVEPSDCSLVLGPSVPIEGRVLDAKTQRPLAGVRVQPASTVFAHALTDAQGRYRIDALPLGSNMLEVVPPKGSPYLPGGVTVDTTAGSTRAVREVALTAGILVRGRAIDERTQQPVRGAVQYFAFEPNPLLEKTDSLRRVVTQNKVLTDAEGRFEIAALPGSGILGFESAAAEFPHGVGADRIQGSRRGVRGRFQQFQTVPEICRPPALNLLVPLNPRADEREIALDLKLRSSLEVPVHIVAFDGRPLSGESFVQGANDRTQFRPHEGDRFKIAGYLESEPRRIVVYHPAQNLVGFYDLSGAPPATLTITLRPSASIAGRVLDAEGLPVSRVQIRCEDTRLVTTDANGRFEIKGVIPGLKYSGRPFPMRREMNESPFGFGELFTDVTAKEGETKQLGDVRLKRRDPKRGEKNSGEVKGAKAATSEPGQPEPRDSKQPEIVSHNGRLRLAARVLDPNGKPVAGASVAIHALLGRNVIGRGFDSRQLGSVTTDSLGRFEYSADLKSLPNFKGGSPKSAAVVYVATMTGFGLAISQYSNLSKVPPADLKLVPDEPVRGRVLNLEGRPVAGARVDVTTLHMDTELLTKLQQMESKGIREIFAVRGTIANSPAMLPSATTDADGRFELRGLGRDRLANLRIIGPQIAVSLLQVVTRPMPKTEIKLRSNGGGSGNGPNIFYGSQFEFVAAPGLPVEGTVTDEETGAPIAGVLVASDWLRVPSTISPRGVISAVSDAKGRYKLEGMPLDDVNTLKAFATDLPYLSAGNLEVPRGTPPQAISRDIKLRRGVWAVGRVLNAKTGEPVKGGLFYTPFRSNELAKGYPRYQSKVHNSFGNDPEGLTDDEGRFRILVIPGRGLVCFRSFQGHYIPGNGAANIPELTKMKSRRRGEGPTYDSFAPTFFEAVHEISPAADAKTVEVNLSVDPGQNVALHLVDPSGKPLTGLLRTGGLNGISPLGGINSNEATVSALSPSETRIVWIQHKATGLTKYMHFTAKPGESERTVTLEPPAVLTGRFVSTEGKPYAGWSVDCQFSIGYHSGFPPVRTDSDGGFRCEIPGGGPFDLVSRSGPAVTVASNLTVQSGEQLDFGELVVNDGDERVDFTTKVAPKRTKLNEAGDVTAGRVPQRNSVAQRRERAISCRDAAILLRLSADPGAHCPTPAGFWSPDRMM